jgi:hypothetical protein
MDPALNDDLEVEWVPNGIRLSVEFSMKRPFMGPVSCVHDVPRRGNFSK